MDGERERERGMDGERERIKRVCEEKGDKE